MTLVYMIAGILIVKVNGLKNGGVMVDNKELEDAIMECLCNVFINQKDGLDRSTTMAFRAESKPLIEFVQRETERAGCAEEERDGAVKERIFLANRIQEKDVLIAKLRAALKPINSLTINGHQTIRELDPEIMEEKE